MSRFLVKLAYDGTNFQGWQVQPKVRTVQEVLENIMGNIAKKKTSVTGSGRTDAGVHAYCQYAHFDLDLQITPIQILKGINSQTPEDILITDVFPVADDFHARFDACSRTYQYVITRTINPFNRLYRGYFPRKNIHPDYIEAVLPLFLGEHDFTNFSRQNPDIPNHRCNISEFQIEEKESDIVLTIKADRFLHNMVRRIVGTLVNLSHIMGEKMIIESLLLGSDKYRKYIFTAPAAGLFLIDVGYPPEKLSKY